MLLLMLMKGRRKGSEGMEGLEEWEKEEQQEEEDAGMGTMKLVGHCCVLCCVCGFVLVSGW